MNLKKRGPVWWVDFRDSSGNRRRVSTREADQAAAYVRAGEIVKAAKALPAAAPSAASRLLSDALEDTFTHHWARSRSSKVMRHTVDLLQRELAGIALDDVTTKALRTHCERWLAAGTAPATVNRRMSAIGVALSHAVEDGELAARPKLPHYAENNLRERFMTRKEEAAVLAWIERRAEADAARAADWRYLGAAAVFLLDTGLRFSELFKFELLGGHANLKHGETKTGAGRRVPLTTRASLAASQMLTSQAHADLSAMPTKAAWDRLAYLWGIATSACGCADVTLHILRHTCASRLVQHGVPIFTVSKWLGHSSVKVTERYAKLAPDSLANALAALEAA